MLVVAIKEQSWITRMVTSMFRMTSEFESVTVIDLAPGTVELKVNSIFPLSSVIADGIFGPLGVVWKTQP